MTILTAWEIRELIKTGILKIEPFEEDLIRENGIDLRLAPEYAVIKQNILLPEIDVSRTDPREVFEVYKNVDYIVIPPKTFVLACTLEYIKMPEDVVGLCNLRSTLARWGLSIPPTVVDAGFEGQLTIEIFNNTSYTIRIPAYTPFLHLVLVEAQGAIKYMGTYRGQRGVTLPKNLHPVPPKNKNSI